MDIIKLDYVPQGIRGLWEENMEEPWEDYQEATHFVQLGRNGEIVAGFAVYYDESDDVCGNFISGWSSRKNIKSVEYVIKYLAEQLGEIFIKTKNRAVKIIAQKLGKEIKKQGEFVYYIVRGL